MSTSLPLDPKDLDLVAAFAAGELDDADATKAESLIASNSVFADEFKAQLEAIAAVGGDDWYPPLNDFEKLALRKAAVPEKEKASWSLRALAPLSVAAVLVVLVGFVGMQFSGDNADTAIDSAEAAISPAATESLDTESTVDDQSRLADGSLEEAASDVAEASMPAAIESSVGLAPNKGVLEPQDLGEVESLGDLYEFSQWGEPVPLDRYAPLSCWLGEDGVSTLGVGTASVNGVLHEIVVGLLAVEARSVGTCEPTILER